MALTPAAAAGLMKSQLEVLVEREAGIAAGFPDDAYVAKGVKVVDRSEVFASADVLLQVRSSVVTRDPELSALKRGCLLIGFCDPLGAPVAVAGAAAERGGNCELTEPGNTVVKYGVTIIGHTNIAATVPLHASSMYANNLSKLLALLVTKEGGLKIDVSDEVIAGCLVAHEGTVVHPRVKALLERDKVTVLENSAR